MMHRIDSGFIDSSQPNKCDKTSTTVQRSNTGTHRHRKSGKTSTDSKMSTRSMASETSQSRSERRPKPTGRTSTASSENSTTRSKGRGHGSKPSSRRTSCTIVDPSRPARHYRLQSSHSIPTAATQDIDDVLALHFRSCSLFTNPSYHSHTGLPSPTLSQREFSSATSRFSTDEMPVVAEVTTSKQSEESTIEAEKLNATMHWTSPSTRRRDYERIDKANSGIRGFFRRVVPRCVSGPQEKFYEKDQSDAGSVRRYRLDDDDVNDQIDEKDALRRELAKMKRPSTQAGVPKKKWACF